MRPDFHPVKTLPFDVIEPFGCKLDVLHGHHPDAAKLVRGASDHLNDENLIVVGRAVSYPEVVVGDEDQPLGYVILRLAIAGTAIEVRYASGARNDDVPGAA